MALGTLEVHPIDLLTAYSTLANGGTRVERTSILRVTDTAGADVIRPYQPSAGDPVFDPQAAYIMTDILAGNTNPDVNPYWGTRQVEDGNGDARPAALKTGTNNDAIDLNAYGFLAPPTAEGRQRGEYALAIGAWNGNSDNTGVNTPGGDNVFSLDVTARVWESFIEEATAEWQINQFTDHRPDGIVEAEVDAFSGMLPGAFSEHTVTELFIDGTVPRDEDNTKVALQVQAETGRLWQNGCSGQPVTRGYLDFDDLESDIPVWNEYVRDWIERAKRGPGVVGGPDETRTSYFVDLNIQPFGQTWGAQWPPTQTCSIAPTPSPTPPPTPEPTASPEATPSPEPTQAPEPTPGPTLVPTPGPPTPTPAP
jgi:membrane peptidoglycan carboxypeptidase